MVKYYNLARIIMETKTGGLQMVFSLFKEAFFSFHVTFPEGHLLMIG